MESQKPNPEVPKETIEKHYAMIQKLEERLEKMWEIFMMEVKNHIEKDPLVKFAGFGWSKPSRRWNESKALTVALALYNIEDIPLLSVDKIDFKDKVDFVALKKKLESELPFHTLDNCYANYDVAIRKKKGMKYGEALESD